MVGGFLYGLLTGGTPPFHWLMDNLPLLSLRRASRGPVGVPGLRGVTAPGLHGKSVLEVAKEDGEPIPWRVRVDGSPGSAGRLEALKALLVQCLAAEPGARPEVLALLTTVDDLLVAEKGEVRALGAGPGLHGPPTALHHHPEAVQEDRSVRPLCALHCIITRRQSRRTGRCALSVHCTVLGRWVGVGGWVWVGVGGGWVWWVWVGGWVGGGVCVTLVPSIYEFLQCVHRVLQT
jgi:hypothetical protein